MDIIEIIKKRRSIRRFKADPIPDDLIKKVIEIATFAPSSCNIQGWRFIVVNDQKIKEEIVNQGGAITIKTSPIGILIVYDKRTRNLEYQDHIQSGAAAIQNLLLAATHFGLGSCWICQLPPKRNLRKILKIPDNFSPISYVILGFEEREPVEVKRAHLLDSLIGYNAFNSQSPQEKISTLKLFFYRVFRRFYYLLPVFLKKKFLNKFIDKKFVKKFDN
ncbi:MAG: nitroreductase family protein [Candidatus Nealsonbacteria bacterium]|nr:nitroreductase family protein [Candidatus Nealsonbacteria bacterium]